MRAKTFTDAVFASAYGTTALGSAAAAAQALVDSGAAGAFALATSETGVGAIAGGAVAVEELARAGVLGITSVASKGMFDRSVNALKGDSAKLSGLVPEIKNVYNSIKEAPTYPKGFEAVKQGTRRYNVDNKKLLDGLREVEHGEWKKVFKDGYDSNGNRISIHYFESVSGKVFNVKVKTGWSNL